MEEPLKAPEKKAPEELTCPEWMMTMGDCMSLLLTFFVLLLTFSTTSKSKLMDVVGVMKGAFSIMKVEMIKNESAYNDADFKDDEQRRIFNAEGSSNMRLTSNAIQRKIKILQETVTEIGFKHPLSLSKLDDGIAIEIPIEEIFIKGTNTLTFNGKKVIQEISNIAFNITNEIRIMSNLSQMHMSGKKLSQEWLKANERNTRIVRMLIDDFGINESRFSIGVQVREVNAPKENYRKVSVIFVENLKVKEVGIEELLKGSF